MQACAAPGKKPPSKPRRKKSRRSKSVVTRVPTLKETKPSPGLLFFTLRALRYFQNRQPSRFIQWFLSKISRTICSNSYGQNSFNFYLCTSKKSDLSITINNQNVKKTNRITG